MWGAFVLHDTVYFVYFVSCLPDKTDRQREAGEEQTWVLDAFSYNMQLFLVNFD